MGNYYRNEYHCHEEAWERKPQNLVGDHVGIELEVDYGYRPVREAASYTDILEALPNPRGKNANNLRPATEDDGSLSSNGVEIVFPPLPVSRVLGDKSFFRRAINTMRDTLPEYHGHADAGLHISLNINGWDSDLIHALILAFNWMPVDFIEAIGGRELTSYCAQYNGAEYFLDDEDEVPYDEDDEDDGETLCQCRTCRHARGELSEEARHLTSRILRQCRFNHDAIVNRENSRLEFRYPASTLNMDQIARNITFIYYVRDYLKREIERGKLKIAETQEETFGTREELKEKVVSYIITRRDSKKKATLMEVINATTHRRQAA